MLDAFHSALTNFVYQLLKVSQIVLVEPSLMQIDLVGEFLCFTAKISLQGHKAVVHSGDILVVG